MVVNCLLFGVAKGWLLVGGLEKYSGNMLSGGEVGRDLGKIFARRNKLIFCHS